MWTLPLLLLLAIPRITLSITPHICLAPCDLRIQVKVDPRPENRWLRVVVDGPSYSESDKQLEGVESPTTQPYQWVKGLRAGMYVITAEIGGGDKVWGRVGMEVEVD